MATFTVDLTGSFVSGSAASDTFDIAASTSRCTVPGLGGDDVSTSATPPPVTVSMAVPATTGLASTATVIVSPAANVCRSRPRA